MRTERSASIRAHPCTRRLPGMLRSVHVHDSGVSSGPETAAYAALRAASLRIADLVGVRVRATTTTTTDRSLAHISRVHDEGIRQRRVAGLSWASPVARTLRPSPSRRERYEGLVIVGNGRESLRGPVGLGLFDAVEVAVDDVPPDVAFPDWFTAQHDGCAGSAQ